MCDRKRSKTARCFTEGHGTEVPCSVQWAALANEFKKIKRRLAEGCSTHGCVRRLAQTWPRRLAQPHVDVCVAQRLLGSRLRPADAFSFGSWSLSSNNQARATQTKKRVTKAGEVTMTWNYEPRLCSERTRRTFNNDLGHQTFWWPSFENTPKRGC
jgi:hypothetical protein